MLPVLLLLTFATITPQDSKSRPKERAPKDSRGEILWRVDLDSDSKGTGAIADIDGDGRPEVIFGTYFRDRHLYALNGEDGSLCWKHLSDRGPMDASVLIADLEGKGALSTLSADSSSGRIFCLDGKGKLRWAYSLPNSTDSPPSIDDVNGDGRLDIIAGSMWKGDGKGDVTCFDALNRKVHWTTPIPGCVQSEPVLVDLDVDGKRDVVVTSWRGDRGVHALSGKDGERLWRFETAGDDKSMGMYHGVTVIHEDEEDVHLAIATTEGDVYVLDQEGKQRWHRHFDDYIFAPTAAADLDGDGSIELIVSARTLWVLDAEDGTTVWKKSFRRSCSRGVAIVDLESDGDLDLVFAVGSELYAVDGREGEELMRVSVATPRSDPMADIGGVLIDDLDQDGTLDAFCVIGRGHYGGENKGEQNHGQAIAVSLGKGTGAWKTFRGNAHRTGYNPPMPSR